MADDQVALTKQIKEANDIVAVVGSYLPLQPAGGTFKGLCPFHNDHRPSFDVDPRRQRFRCWSCGKFGDVLTFVQEFEHVGFREARELLARRAGIALGPAAVPDQGRLRLLATVRWAAEQYQTCLLESALGESARTYLGQRKLLGETVRRFGLGYAPLGGDWLVERAGRAAVDFDALVEVGLLGRRKEGAGFYDRFRDRVMFPIRDARGQTVGFGGRILPGSPLESRAPKYYNSAETPLFSKSELIYGLDQARSAAANERYLAVVEGYTDVLMAHQAGVANVVATMGTALNARHVQQLRRFVARVVLVFDADAGGTTGVDRALEIFVSQDLELAVATLPGGLDPCDLLVEQGVEPFRQALGSAVDALDFKLGQVLAREAGTGVEGRRRVVDAVLGIIALAPDAAGQAARVKQELIVTRVAQRLGLREETVWARLDELRDARRAREAKAAPTGAVADGPSAHGPAAPEERELLEVLLAEPALVAQAAAAVAAVEIAHPDVRYLLEQLYALHAAGEPPDLDGLRLHLDRRLADAALRLQEIGRTNPRREEWLQRLLAVFEGRRKLQIKRGLQDQLAGTADHAAAVALLRQLQDQVGRSA